ncbi:MAG: VanZ family protein [Bacilli bacterium]|nr:VanZ family protein [Bacilli bacterium]
MLKNTIQSVINFTWPMIVISIVIIVSLRLSYLIKNKEKIVLYREIMMLVFIIYTLCLFQVVTFQDDVSWASNNFIPFKEIMRYKITNRLFIKNVLGNMIMFLPFGFFTSLYLKSEKITLPLLLTLIASLSIEIVQMIIGRVFDVDDIMLNLIGGALGYLVYSMFRNMSNHLPSFCRKEWFLNIVSVIILTCLVFGLVIIII